MTLALAVGRIVLTTTLRASEYLVDLVSISGTIFTQSVVFSAIAAIRFLSHSPRRKEATLRELHADGHILAV
jgi:hypothetical protein